MKIFFATFLIVASFLSTFAQAPSNYYSSVSGLSGTALKAELHSIIDNHTVISYNGLWSAFQSTDAKPDGKVWDIYTDKPGSTPTYTFTFITKQCGNYSKEGDCYNREHSFPQSWFNDQSPMVSDLFQVYPTDGWVNNKRGNYPYGQTTSPTYTSSNGSEVGPCSYPGYTGTVFEPIDSYKGDIARTYFYMATRYYGEDGNWPGSAMVNGAEPTSWAKNMLLEWHTNDPVSQKEIDRNNAIYAYQKNRNPFIDHPEYVGYIWGGSTPGDGGTDPGNGGGEETDITPSNHVSHFSSSFIQLNWTDAQGASVPDGYLVLYSTESFIQIPTPTNGISPQDYTPGKVVMQGTGKCVLGNLQSQTDYYIKIFSYTGSGTQTLYKTDASVPQLIKKTN